MARVYIVHGYQASPESHWFDWLKSQLSGEVDATYILKMPDTDAPKTERWVGTLRDAVGEPDEQTLLVGHSLGTITVLRYLNELAPEASIGGIVLVSGFCEPLPNMPELDPFAEGTFDFEKIKRIAPLRVVIGAKDDQLVAPELTERLAHAVDARLIQFPEGGHFLDEDGYTELPVVLDELRQMIHAARE